MHVSVKAANIIAKRNQALRRAEKIYEENVSKWFQIRLEKTIKTGIWPFKKERKFTSEEIDDMYERMFSFPYMMSAKDSLIKGRDGDIRLINDYERLAVTSEKYGSGYVDVDIDHLELLCLT